MFQILSALDHEKPGSMINMLKYFYLVPRLGIKEFSTIKPAFLMYTKDRVVTIMGTLSGWNKLTDRFKQ